MLRSATQSINQHTMVCTQALLLLLAFFNRLTKLMDWRGHAQSQASDQDFGYAEMLADALAVIQASGAQAVIPIAQAHGGWVVIELRRRLGERAPKMIFTSRNPLAPLFLGAMQASQDNARWRETV